ncbi:hypothetical protein QR680_008972 [Steinernema hermaphroditum]|uniref:Uncharacterized protein n=1 Tax=Steinernema hermaphroditum TaxID=289476 RepID=A0AA39IJY6_9BILA|nr:hypothetical protein QR680_008972 [Steinernema hermaphroditum]
MVHQILLQSYGRRLRDDRTKARLCRPPVLLDPLQYPLPLCPVPVEPAIFRAPRRRPTSGHTVDQWNDGAVASERGLSHDPAGTARSAEASPGAFGPTVSSHSALTSSPTLLCQKLLKKEYLYHTFF